MTDRNAAEPPSEVRLSFAEQLDSTKADVLLLAALTTEAVNGATRSLLDADLSGAERVVATDERITGLRESIELRVYELFARQQPMASDLRTLLAVLRILSELQLAADLTVSISKSARRLYPSELPPRVRGLFELIGGQASVQLNLALDAFADRDDAIASALPDMDDVIDDLQKDLFRAIFETSSRDEAGLQQAVQLALLGRFYERIADHAVLIGAWVRFMVTGEIPSRADQHDSGTPS